MSKERFYEKRIHVNAYPPFKLCDGCRKCIEVCPKHVLTPYPGNVVFAHNWLACNYCGECLKVCERNAIKLEVPISAPKEKKSILLMNLTRQLTQIKS